MSTEESWRKAQEILLNARDQLRNISPGMIDKLVNMQSPP
jgi:hypothetical protein